MRPNPVAQGARPAGVEPGDEAVAARAIREMFGRVAPRYDLLNHLLSGQIDRFWRYCLVRAVRPYLSRPGVRVADLCCGTGDLALALARESARLQPSAGRAVLASDFSRPMLRRAAAKLAAKGSRGWLAEADATRMPLPDGCLDLITVAYGLRNLASYRGGALEFARLLAPGGCLAVLEFSQPQSRVWGAVFDAYFRYVLPRIGDAVSASGGAYAYLQDSVAHFPSPPEVCGLFREAGFARAAAHSLTGGVSMLYLAYR